VFDQETINAFPGGYKITVPAVVTLFGSPHFSRLKSTISMPISLSFEALVRKSEMVNLRGSKNAKFEYNMQKLTNEWSDPIKMMTTISIQRGWKFPPDILLNEGITFNSSIGYYSGFIDLLVYSFSSVNGIHLSNSEFVELSGEIQDKIRDRSSLHETVTRAEGKDENILIYDWNNGSFRNEPFNFEPYSLYLITDNSLDMNENYNVSIRNLKRYRDQNIDNNDPSTMNFPYIGIFKHFQNEAELFRRIETAIQQNDSTELVYLLSKYSQSLAFNILSLSGFQKTLSSLLDKYKLTNYIFNIGEYSGSILLFCDSMGYKLFSENVLREYYNLTNRTISVSSVKIGTGHTIEKIKL